jgi:hypothetical protein
MKLKLAYVLVDSHGKHRSRLRTTHLDGTEVYELVTILCEEPIFMYVIFVLSYYCLLGLFSLLLVGLLVYLFVYLFLSFFLSLSFFCLFVSLFV